MVPPLDASKKIAAVLEQLRAPPHDDAKERIDATFEKGARVQDDARALVEEFRPPCRPAIRSAEPDASAHGWRVNEWVKRGILLAFRFGDTVDMTVDHGRWPFFDKHATAQGTRRCRRACRPGGSSIRDGAYLGKGVICMPPMYINIGAYVGDESLIDSHALVGSCAQVGRRVHVSGGADRRCARTGGRVARYRRRRRADRRELRRLRRGGDQAPRGAGVGHHPHRFDPDLRHYQRCHHQSGPGRAARGSRRRGGCPGIASDPIRAWEGLATLGRHPDHREIPRREDERENSTGRMDTVAALAFARALIDIDSTTGEEAAAGAWLASALRDLGYQVVEQPVEGDRFNVLAAIDKPEVVLSTHFDCVPPFFPSSIRDGNLCGRGACDAKGFSRRRSRRPALRAAGNTEWGCCSSSAKSGAAMVRRPRTARPRSRFLVNGEPTSSQVATGTRGILRLRLRASGRAGHSSAPEHFESAIEKLIDALVGLRRLPIPCNDIFGATSYSIGLIEGGVAPNVVPASASAEVMFRTVGDADEVLQAVGTLEPLVHVEEVLRVPPCSSRRFPESPPRAFRLRRISPYSTAGARHSSMVLAPSSSRIPTTSTWPWPSSRRASTATSRSSGRCYRAGEGLGRVTTVRGRRSAMLVESDGRT